MSVSQIRQLFRITLVNIFQNTPNTKKPSLNKFNPNY